MAEVFGGEIEQDADVGVVQAVVDHAPGAAIADDASRAQQAQGMGHGGLRCLDSGSQIAHAQLAHLGQGIEEPDSGGITEETEQLGEPLRLLRRQQAPTSGGDPLRVEGGDGAPLEPKHLVIHA